MDSQTFKKLLKTTDKYIHILESNHIGSPQDLLRYLPRTYEDRTQIKRLADLVYDDSTQVVKGNVIKKTMITTPRGKRLTEIHFIDENEQKGHINALHSSYLLRSVGAHKRYYIIGKPTVQNGKIVFRHPEIVPAVETVGQDDAHVGRIYPLYSDLQGIKGQWFSKKIQTVLSSTLSSIQETLPTELLNKFKLLSLQETLQQLHHPESMQKVDQARERLFFDKLFRIQLTSLLNKKEYQSTVQHELSGQPDREHIKIFLEQLPFTLTGAQKHALKDLIEDIHRPTPMLRLMQGDVGSGKTIVATAAAWYCITQGYGQVALLAPIEVLARQHYKNLAKLLLPLGVRVELLIGATPTKEKDRIKQGLAHGQIPFVVGTHALLQDDVVFKNLCFAIIDEQHKFGVRQRAVLQQHGSPHILQMTATPIPRSLALAFFGEFDVSTIDELPAGRKPITTKIISEEEFKKLKPRMLTKISQGQRVFLITPLIEESEMLDEVKSAMQVYKYMQELYSEIKDTIGLLHGKLKSDQKEEVMSKFKHGTYTLLVSTTVIEVGIDVPEATVMIIYNAERFGLSQLHQLRGRVGRSDLQSYCFLETKKKSGETYKRLKYMEEITDGFKLAEIDLQFRGPGEFLGVRQSGETDLPVDLLTNTKFLEKVQEAAQRAIQKETDLTQFLEYHDPLQLI